MNSAGDRFLIRLYGDSLSLPRAQAGIGFADIYPELLCRQLEAARPGLRASVFNRSAGGAPIAVLEQTYLQDRAYLGPDAAGILILQCGIVDCAPRPIPPAAKALLGHLHARLRQPIVWALHRGRPFLLRNGIRWQATAPGPFEAGLRRILADASRHCEQVYVLNIAPTVPAIERHSPGLTRCIEDYNQRLARVAGEFSAAAAGCAVLVDVHGAITARGDVATYVSPNDGHHITREGHRLYAELIAGYELRRTAGRGASGG